jgi:hypothetical protein
MKARHPPQSRRLNRHSAPRLPLPCTDGSSVPLAEPAKNAGVESVLLNQLVVPGLVDVRPGRHGWNYAYSGVNTENEYTGCIAQTDLRSLSHNRILVGMSKAFPWLLE